MPNKTLVLTKVSAWGLGLFQSPFDHNRIAELDEEAGLPALTETAIAHARQSGASMPMENTPRGLWCDPKYGINYTLLPSGCSDAAATRAHLDPGLLAKMLARWDKVTQAEAQEDQSATPTARDKRSLELRQSPGYKYVLLGACAMALGCVLPQGTKTTMRQRLAEPNVDFRRVAVKQLEATLHPDTGYRNGVAWEFGSKTKAQVFADGGAPSEERLYPETFLVDCQSPYGMLSLPKEIRENVNARSFGDASDPFQPMPGTTAARHHAPAEFIQGSGPPKDAVEIEAFLELMNTASHELLAARMKDSEEDPSEHATKDCAGCLVKAGKTPMWKCARCHKEAYCSPACQKWHWKEHKLICNDNPMVLELEMTKFIEL